VLKEATMSIVAVNGGGNTPKGEAGQVADSDEFVFTAETDTAPSIVNYSKINHEITHNISPSADQPDAGTHVLHEDVILPGDYVTTSVQHTATSDISPWTVTHGGTGDWYL
jgi:hypothetical protein